MDVYETNTFSFIVKIWFEEAIEVDGQPELRGYITKVPNGKAQYFRDLSEIAALIASHLEGTGLRLAKQSRVRRWLTWCKLYLTGQG